MSEAVSMDEQAIGRKRQHCKYCNHFYQKHEHLIRHERTHTGDKPFICDLCSRSFARLDTLGRHKKTHRNASQNTPAERSQSDNMQRNILNDQNQPQDDPGLAWMQTENILTGAEFPVMNTPVPDLDPFPEIDSSLLAPMNGTEEILQYLFPSPVDWTIPVASGNEAPGTTKDPDSADLVQHVEDLPNFANETSPAALLQLNAMIRETAANYRREVRQKGITSLFFDVCLSLYFTQFNDTFPVVHAATWTLTGTSPFLLLNMVAIGSLFIGTADALTKGQFLWEVAHTAAATRWNHVYDQKLRTATTDASNTQIVTCALVGQLYAMLSKDAKLRQLAQSLHGWAFSWARRLGMFDTTHSSTAIPEMISSMEEKTNAWKQWSTLETQRRTVLGLYIVDAELARYSGGLPVGKHVLNPLHFSSDDAIFRAKTADEWIFAMHCSRARPCSFRELYLLAFQTENPQSIPSLSPYSVLVVLEGIQAVISERSAAGGNAIGIPAEEKIKQALLQIRRTCFSVSDESLDGLELRLRWHTLCVDLQSDSVQLFRQLWNTQQSVFCVDQSPPQRSDEISQWTQTPKGRKALLHAVMIQDLAQSLNLGKAYGPTTPAAVFTAAVVYCAFCEGGKPDVSVPAHIEWEALLDAPLEESESPTRLFIQGARPRSNNRTLNLRLLLYKFQAILRAMSLQWGIADDMMRLLDEWTPLAV